MVENFVFNFLGAFLERDHDILCFQNGECIFYLNFDIFMQLRNKLVWYKKFFNLTRFIMVLQEYRVYVVCT
jgi:hypothetical protein